jgi:hypothetical protein
MFSRASLIAMLLVSSNANAQFAVAITTPKVALKFSPSSPAVECDASPSAVVAAITAKGGNGRTVSVSITGGDDADFDLSASSLPANVIVGATGVNSCNCGQSLIVTPSQN